MAYKSALIKSHTSSLLHTKKPKFNKDIGILSPKLTKRPNEQQLANCSTSSSTSCFLNQKDLDISSSFERPEWTEKTLDEKNQWVTRFLSRMRMNVSCVFKHMTDLITHEDTAMKDEAYELLSMPGIKPQISATDDCLWTIRTKLLEDKYAKLSSDLENKDQTIKDLSEQLNKDARSQETQTCEINIDELKNSLSDKSSENTSLRLKLDSSNQLTDILHRDLSVKSDELASLSIENASLTSKIENLNKAFNEMKTQNSKQSIRIGQLQTEKDKFKQDFLEVRKERDDYYESWMGVKDKYEKTSEELKKKLAESDEIRRDVIQKSMIESGLIDRAKQLEMEIGDKEEETEKLRSVVGQLEKTVQKYRKVDEVQSKTIKRLEANVKQMETRAQCWINRNVRDKFETKINNLEQLVETLKTDKKLLSDEYKKTAKDYSEQAAKREKYSERLQSHMNEQQELINLMRRVKFNPSKFEKSSVMDSIFLKFDDEQKMRQDLEKLIQENYVLQKRNTEYKKIFDSHPFKQLFVTY